MIHEPEPHDALDAHVENLDGYPRIVLLMGDMRLNVGDNWAAQYLADSLTAAAADYERQLPPAHHDE